MVTCWHIATKHEPKRLFSERPTIKKGAIFVVSDVDFTYIEIRRDCVITAWKFCEMFYNVDEHLNLVGRCRDVQSAFYAFPVFRIVFCIPCILCVKAV